MYFDFGSLNYIGTDKPSNPNIGDVVINIENNITTTSIYDGKYWYDCVTVDKFIDCVTVDKFIPNPIIEYREIKPKLCVRCGAPLHGHKCEYCDTEYS